LIALVAPEFVLYAAYIQWRNARKLCKELKKLDAGLDALGGSSDARNEPMDGIKEATNVSNELIDPRKGLQTSSKK